MYMIQKINIGHFKTNYGNINLLRSKFGIKKMIHKRFKYKFWNAKFLLSKWEISAMENKHFDNEGLKEQSID